MKIIKRQKGITLVALIITIVVLLILAVVVIAAIQSDGIFGYSINGTKKYKLSQAQEIATVGTYDAFLTEKIDNVEVDPLQIAISNLEKAGYKLETVIFSGVTGIRFVNEKGEVALLSLQTGSEVEVEVEVVVENGARKNYVLIDKLYHEISYTDTTKKITILENGIEQLPSGTVESTDIILTAPNILKINGEDKVTVPTDTKIKIKAQDTADTKDITATCGDITGKLTVKVTKPIAIGTYIEYDVPYTDINTGILYTKDGGDTEDLTTEIGWRYFGKDENGNNLLMSTGIPLELYYDHLITGQIDVWRGTEGNINNQVAYGLMNNFNKIPFYYQEVNKSSNIANAGIFNNINGTTGMNEEGNPKQLKGNEFISLIDGKLPIKVRLATRYEIEEKIPKESEEFRDVDQIYWLASYDSSSTTAVECVTTNGRVTSNVRYHCGVRPVIVLPADVDIASLVIE